MNLIPDSELLKIKINDNEEDLVDMRDYCPGTKFEIGDHIRKEGEQSFHAVHFIRKGVAEKLNAAQKKLLDGYTFLVYCGYRLPELQIKLYTYRLNSFKKTNPEWDDEKVKLETSKCVAPMELASHCAGAAIDISLAGPNGKSLDMGTEYRVFTPETYTNADGISKIAKKNRTLLIDVMQEAGLINFPTEWWHWSYGDTYWAAELKKDFTMYGPKKFK